MYTKEIFGCVPVPLVVYLPAAQLKDGHAVTKYLQSGHFQVLAHGTEDAKIAQQILATCLQHKVELWYGEKDQ